MNMQVTMRQETYSYVEGRYKHKLPVTIAEVGGRIYFQYPFNRPFMAEIKSSEGTQWHQFQGNKEIPIQLFGTDKIWSIEDTLRNRFVMDYWFGRNPYQWYDAPLIDFKPTRNLYKHQCELAAFALTRHYCIIAAEMGTGKTLAAIEVMEQSGITDWWYVAPKSALRAVEREFRIWQCKIKPRLATYDDLRREMQQWLDGKKAPQGVIFDESSRVKTPTAQRSQAALQLANGIRSDWGRDGFVILMSGSPAPKSPLDWWHQCEVACPGFIKEGTIQKFQLRLGVFEKKESLSGGVFNQQVTWLDDEKKCAKCGQLEADIAHSEVATDGYHPFQASKNEVAHLYKRMNGLVTVKFKKDCLDLPEKIYKIIECKPKPEILRSAKLIAAKAKNTISAMTLLRELSDGFQYKDRVEGKQKCEVCGGSRKYIVPEGTILQGDNAQEIDIEIKDGVCPYCDENGEQDRIIRETVQVTCPKEDALRAILDEHDEIGRLVVYGGFTGSVDRIVRICQDEKWSVIRVDGRGWWNADCNGTPLVGDPLTIFQDQLKEHPRVAFVGQPGAAGMGLTLTASPSICYYSNDFNAESRIQSEDRIHRAGMDRNRGATIIDLIHLPTDRTVLDNLKAKRKLQDMTLGVLSETLDGIGADDERLF